MLDRLDNGLCPGSGQTPNIADSGAWLCPVCNIHYKAFSRDPAKAKSLGVQREERAIQDHIRTYDDPSLLCNSKWIANTTK